MKFEKPLVSVIIPHLNQPDMLDICLTSLEAQSLDRALFEIVVVDNGSAIIPVEVAARHPGVKLFCERQPGPGPARNLGISKACAPVLAFIDADCCAHPDWLRKGLNTLQALPEGVVLGGDVQISREDSARFTAIEAYESVFAYRFKLYIEQQGFSGTGNLMVRRADFDQVGPFAGIQIAEDMDWGGRACRAGLRFQYVPGMVVYHPARRSLQELCLKWDRQIQHYINMARGKPAWQMRWALRALAVLASPTVDFVKVLGSDRVFGLPARLKAIMVLIAIRAHRSKMMLALLLQNGTVLWNREKSV